MYCLIKYSEKKKFHTFKQNVCLRNRTSLFSATKAACRYYSASFVMYKCAQVRVKVVYSGKVLKNGNSAKNGHTRGGDDNMALKVAEGNKARKQIAIVHPYQGY